MYISKKAIQIFYADSDMMGVVYHANYLKWFELGRSALIEELGFNYLAMEAEGYFAPVYDAHVTYKKPVRFGENVYVKTWVEESNGIRTVYGYQIVDDTNDVRAEGSTTHVIVRKDNFRPANFKKAFPEWFAKYEEIKKKPAE
ncbi:thioesterase family protein [Bacillus carboniphilus]|uniref:Thioesterase family protein n=1 Tax=Bacillus carboniphilus TaxID=86663 RepID=A0ABN0VQY4_9BACI